MNLDEMLLQKLADWRPDSGPQTLEIDDAASGWKAVVSTDAVDTLGCRLHEVILTRTTPLTGAGDLADQAQRIANRVSGLLEPLCLVEVDGEHDLAQLRSESPAKRGAALHYYEVLRHGDGTTRLNRYEASPAGPRKAIGFALTHEALAKVVSDLATV
jgi:hypothetical protein